MDHMQVFSSLMTMSTSSALVLVLVLKPAMASVAVLTKLMVCSMMLLQ
jgi:hypothetical protein